MGKRDPCINRDDNGAIVLGPAQQNVKKNELFSASISVELIKVFLAGGKMQMLTKSMRPAAKSTDTGRFGSFCKQAIHIHTRVYAQCSTQRQICDTQCPCDPYAPYGQEEGRENKHTALWVTAAWQSAKPRGLRCWGNIMTVGAALFSVPVLLSCFLYCSVEYGRDGCGEKVDAEYQILI